MIYYKKRSATSKSQRKISDKHFLIINWEQFDVYINQDTNKTIGQQI